MNLLMSTRRWENSSYDQDLERLDVSMYRFSFEVLGKIGLIKKRASVSVQQFSFKLSLSFISIRCQGTSSRVSL